MKQAFYPIAAAFVIGSTFSATAAPFTADFNTNQAGSFTVVIASSDSDANANFQYDTSTYTPDASTTNQNVGTAQVLRLNANVASHLVDTDAVNVYPNVTGIGTDWDMTYDVYNSYNGPAGGGSGSTTMHFFGATDSNAIPFKTITSPSIAGTGFYFTMTGEGGAAADYRFYSGSGTIAANNAGVTWHGGAAGTNLNNIDAPWTSFFPSATSTPAGTYESAGAPGKQWLKVRLTKIGTNATVAFKRATDADFVVVGSATVPGTANQPVLGYSDINTGAPNPISLAADNFVLVDNLAIDSVASSVRDWSLYQ